MNGRHLFSGWLTLENVDDVAAHIRAGLHVDEPDPDGPRLHTVVTVNELMGFRPEVRTGMAFADGGITVSRYGTDDHPMAGISLSDSRYSTHIHTSLADREACKGLDNRFPTYQGCWVDVYDGELQVRHCAGVPLAADGREVDDEHPYHHNNRMWWVFTDEGADQWRRPE